MDLALVFSAVMLGAAGAPHCAAMCGPGCVALTRGAGTAGSLGFHAARIAGYAAAGAVAASSVGALAQLGQWSPALRPLWTLLHAAALALGLWLLWHGRQPAWLEALGRNTRPVAPDAQGWQPMRSPARPTLAGALWVAWPCGLLQSALLVAALANTAWGGASVMAAFALTSAAGLSVAPWVLARLGGGSAAGALQAGAWAVRIAGLALVAASAWALGHDVWHRVLAYCFG